MTSSHMVMHEVKDNVMLSIDSGGLVPTRCAHCQTGRSAVTNYKQLKQPDRLTYNGKRNVPKEGSSIYVID